VEKLGGEMWDGVRRPFNETPKNCRLANLDGGEGSAQPATSIIIYQGLGNRPQSVSTNRYANRFETLCRARRAGACKQTALLRPARAKLPAPSAPSSVY